MPILTSPSLLLQQMRWYPTGDPQSISLSTTLMTLSVLSPGQSHHPSLWSLKRGTPLLQGSATTSVWERWVSDSSHRVGTPYDVITCHSHTHLLLSAVTSPTVGASLWRQQQQQCILLLYCSSFFTAQQHRSPLLVSVQCSDCSAHQSDAFLNFGSGTSYYWLV